MKRLFLTILLTVLLTAGAVLGAPRVVEAFQETVISFEPNKRNSSVVAELNFEIDTACVVQIVTGGRMTICKGWLKINSDSLPMLIETTGGWQSPSITYFYQALPGFHEIEFIVYGGYDTYATSICRNGYLQACIFEPDEPSAVVELPVNDTPESRAERVYRVGDLIEVKTLDAAVYDASGRLVERPMGCFAPESSGVYYITGEERIRKVVVQ